ncbi:MAG TPA: hypothetical protein VGG19_18615, partial [Tepidisphaeraceae bacterium]
EKNAPIRAVIFTLLVTFLIFGSVCTFGFVRYDDPENIYANPALNPPKWTEILRTWSEPYEAMYIPVTYTAWGGIAQIAWTNNGMDARWFHLANLLLHALAAVLVYAILREMKFADLAATLGALVFAIHPVQVEAVAWATGLKDVLSGCLGLAALWFYFLARRKGLWIYFVGTILFALALLAKPGAAVVPAIALVVDWWLLRISWQRSLGWLGPWVGMALIVLLVARGVQPSVVHVPATQRIGIAGDALAFYLGHVAMPWNLAIDYGRSPQWLVQQPIIWVNWLIPVVVGMVCWRFSRKAAWIALGVFVVAVLPVLGFSTFDFQQHSTVADRYLYLAMLGVAMLAAMAVRRWPRNGTIVVCGLLVLYGYKTIRHEWAWGDSQRLFAQTLAVNPDSDIANNGIGVMLGNEAMQHYEPAKLQEGIIYLQRAVGSNPDSAGEHANLATLYLLAGDKQRCEEELAVVRRLKPGLERSEQMENLLNGKGKWFSAGMNSK